MAWTQADLDKLEAAIADGAPVQALTFGATTITFRTLDDMLKLQNTMRARLAGTRSRVAAFDKGA